jgi:hypothetical protein
MINRGFAPDGGGCITFTSPVVKKLRPVKVSLIKTFKKADFSAFNTWKGLENSWFGLCLQSLARFCSSNDRRCQEGTLWIYLGRLHHS